MDYCRLGSNLPSSYTSRLSWTSSPLFPYTQSQSHPSDLLARYDGPQPFPRTTLPTFCIHFPFLFHQASTPKPYRFPEYHLHPLSSAGPGPTLSEPPYFSLTLSLLLLPPTRFPFFSHFDPKHSTHNPDSDSPQSVPSQLPPNHTALP